MLITLHAMNNIIKKNRISKSFKKSSSKINKIKHPYFVTGVQCLVFISLLCNIVERVICTNAKFKPDR